MDFYPSTNNYVSPTAIQTFAQDSGGGSGESWIYSFYDQTGNGNTLITTGPTYAVSN